MIKNNLSIKWKKSKTAMNLLAYKKYKCRLEKIINTLERNHIEKQFELYKNNLSRSWQIMKKVINKKCTSTMPKHFEINGKLCHDKKVIANSFNQFYINIGPSFAGDTACDDTSFRMFLNKTSITSIFLEPVTQLEIKKIISSLKNSSPGWDDISAKVIKGCCELILEPLTYIVNLSLAQGVFPNELKIAKVIPLYKGDNSSHIKNYRPVSVLPFFSKVFERAMYNRMISFINTNDILHKLQFGFREKHSTNIALTILVDKIASSLNNGEIVLGAFLHFSKAFDCVNHKILLNKLEHYGIRGVALEWFQSYLSDRKQYVCFEGENSVEMTITCGVPQGSILGPLLFLLYINDIANVSNVLYCILFADDSNVFLTGKNINDMVATMNIELSKLVQWLKVNRLSLNISKTKFMVFEKTTRIKEKLTVTICNQDIEQVQSIKFLGVVIDSKLSWEYHIKYINQKISKAIGLLRKVRRYLNKSCLVTLYYTFLFPYLNYCIEVWGSAAQYHINSLIVLQKKSVRVVTSSGFRDHTYPLFKELNLLPLKQLYFYRIGMFMFKIYHDNVPPVCQSLFITNTSVHSHYTRQRNHLHVPISNSMCLSRTLRIKGVEVWNRIFDFIDVHCSISCFKNRLRNVLPSLVNNDSI